MSSDICFEWDARKAEANKRKHGISFDLATQVFSDEFAERNIEGDEHGEIRWQAVGQIERALVRVTYTSRDKKALKSSGSSRRGKRREVNVVRMKGIPKMNAAMRKELEALRGMSDADIDFSDIPEWSEGEGPVYVGLHYRPGKTSVTIRLDEDMVAWFKSQGKGWQTKMNWALRLYFATHRKTGAIVGRP